MSASTHLECFNQDLPGLKKGDVRYRSVGASGTTTKNTVSPKRFHNMLVKDLENLADKYLPKYKNSPELQRRITTTFPCLPLDSENDVVSTSWTYLILPIMEVLRMQFQDNITLKTEVTDKTKVKVDKIVDEHDHQKVVDTAIRYDLVFQGTTTSPTKTIAVIEYKRRRMLRYTDFGDAILPYNATNKQYTDMKNSHNRKVMLGWMLNALNEAKIQ
ncbi:hypothetical protein TUN199_09264 [Pyrenophora tritici-repentis]|nr:hypothetical protein Alg130_06511 [Pyrenophora tritici-repentis]KAI0609227.1 hypothetical protein TUN205_06513 [Pyrenophora tritici-repentis]KAI0618751.1 hypothetical protein TUN199_09264 [Pyrenophora tritici-repentis]